jgi:cell division protein FtsI/penicillin-binding protein 2
VEPSEEEPTGTRAVGKNSGKMAKKLQYRRLLALGTLLVLAFAGLAYRLVDLQVLRHVELQARAENLTKHIDRLEPRRGNILDIKGNLLATSVFVKTVCANPSLVSNRYADVAHILAPLLQTNETELAQRLFPRTRMEKGRAVPVQYVILKEKVPVEVWEKIQAAMLTLPSGAGDKKLSAADRTFIENLRKSAVYTEPLDDQLRTYPNQRLAAHVLGYLGSVERTNDGVRTTEVEGVAGIESELNDKLSGVGGFRVTERNGRQQELVALREEDVEPRNGLNAVLTIDSVIQHIVETALAGGMAKHSPESISAIVIRPRTGEILAMATLPDFDPNNPGRTGGSADAWCNRLISNPAEPGSTFKIVVVSGGLNEGIVTLDQQFDCENGDFLYAGKHLHDHERYGILSVKSIITKSSNIGAAKIGIAMGEDRLYDYIRAFGFGDRTGIPLPGESRGIVHPVKKWTKVSIAQLPMGQGIAVTPLQMALAMCTVANDGVLMRPMLVDRLQDENGITVVKYSPQQVRRVISEETDRQMIEALKTVVSADGTAPNAALDHYTVAGKTGTAQKSDGTQYLDKFYSSFTGFFPADNPEICIYVALDDPKGVHYGGQVAAPIFKEIAEQAATYLNIRPDRDVEPDAHGKIAAATLDPVSRAVAERTQ